MKTSLMQLFRFSALLLLTVALLPAQEPVSASDLELTSSLPQHAAEPAVTLRAASGATIPFVTQNGRTIGDLPPHALELPHLVLYRNGALSDPEERTLIVQVSGLEVPPAGVTVTLRLETQHEDPDPGAHFGQKIAVWEASRQIANRSGRTQTGVSALFVREFAESVAFGARMIATPTDYLRYEVKVTDADHPATDPLQTFSAETALLMENQWIARLPVVQEQPVGAAPDELVVYYCDMYPFQKDPHDPATWLSRGEVTDYVGSELVPQMVKAYRVQTNEWGFSWYDEWTSYRPEEAERLTVALVDGRTWFHGWAPDRGHSGISIRVKGGDNAAYDTLTDGLMSNYHHELFHNLQRNIQLHVGGDGDVDGPEDVWRFFSEGTAVLASSVGQPRGQFSQTLRARTYMFYANNFVLWGGGKSRGLNTSYREVDPYHAAIYWRFLYEQCGGMHDGIEDPAAGMQVIENALTTLYSGDVVDIRSSTDLVGALPEIMDRALAGSSCPFHTYQESLVAFARALYGLQLPGGRCYGPNARTGCGFYDPYNQYHAPPVSTIAYTGVDHEHRDEIGSSFGIDLIDVVLDPATDGQPLTLEFYGTPSSGAEFDVQIWQWRGSEEGAKPRGAPIEEIAVELETWVNPAGHRFYALPAIQTATCSRLGLIITRLDAQEVSDPLGEYAIVLHPDAKARQATE